MIPFVPGSEYPRADLLAFVGSKQEVSGVIWGPKEPGCAVVTSGGRHSVRAGYSDEPQRDGSWLYFGQGEVGDHNPNSYANRLLIEANRTVLLFTTREPTASEVRARGSYTKRYRYIGAFQVGRHDIFVPETGRRQGHKLLNFVLVPVVDDPDNNVPAEHVLGTDLQALRKVLIADGRPLERKRFTIAAYRKRSGQIRGYALLRAAGKCEGCFDPAPFLNDRRLPFLEVHHMLRLADDGPDIPENVAALCPNCHRKVHYAIDRNQIHKLLVARIRQVETALSRGD